MTLSKTRSCACFNLRRTARAITQYYGRVLKPSGLNATQFTLLAVIAQSEPAPITRLAELLVMERTTLTRNLRPLLSRGLVTVTPGTDQRIRNIGLTQPGRNALKSALPLWKQAQSRIQQTLGEEQFTDMLQALNHTVQISRET